MGLFLIQGFAMLMVLLHSMVPHEHMANTRTIHHMEEHQNVSNWMDYLALGFHHQQVDGDLENFAASTPAAQIELQADFLCFSLLHFQVLSSDLILQEKQVFSAKNQPLLKEISLLNHARRGPPSLFA